jgi:hypothetical protein
MREDKEEGKQEVDEESQLEAVEEVQPAELEAVEGREPEEAPEENVQDRLELDRMEVKEAEEIPQEQAEEAAEAPAETEGEVIIEPPATSQEEAARPGILAMLAGYWVWIVAFLLGLACVSAALLFLAAPEVEQEEVMLGRRVHEVTASLGGEHYVHFNLWGPFRDAKGQEALRRGMPKIKHDLIFSGGRPEVVRSIQENDLYFLERHILDIVGRATGIPTDQLDLKGLSVTRYSDETEVGEEG